MALVHGADYRQLVRWLKAVTFLNDDQIQDLALDILRDADKSTEPVWMRHELR